MSIDVKDFPKVLKKSIEDAVEEITGRGNMQKLGTSVAKDVAKRTQLGYGVPKNGAPREKLKPLAESTKGQRAGKLAFRTNKQGKVYPIEKISPKDVRDLRGSKNARAAAREHNKRVSSFLKENKPRLSPNTTANKSNLTFSGRMIKSIGALVTGIGKVTIGFRTRERARIAAFVSKVRPFMNLSNREEQRLTRRVTKLLRQLLNRNINKNF